MLAGVISALVCLNGGPKAMPFEPEETVLPCNAVTLLARVAMLALASTRSVTCWARMAPALVDVAPWLMTLCTGLAVPSDSLTDESPRTMLVESSSRGEMSIFDSMPQR